MTKNTDLFETLEANVIADVGRTVHSNSHCNALVENPFAWADGDVVED